MKKCHRWLIGISLLLAVVYISGLFWGSHKLAWAAVRNLYDVNLLLREPSVWVNDELSVMTPAQRNYLRSRLNEASQVDNPRIYVNVKWDAWAVARIRSGLSLGPGHSEGNDAIYLCIFGVWVQIYSFGHSIT